MLLSANLWLTDTATRGEEGADPMGSTDTAGLTPWSDTPCARGFSGKRLPWADEEAERAYAQIGPLWDLWYVVHGDDCAKAAWQARPVGATTSLCHGATADALVSAVAEYLRTLSDHIADTRASLAECQPTWIGHVERLNLRLEALLRLQAAAAKTPV